MQIEVLVFDGVDELDALGPYEAFSNARLSGADATVRLVTLKAVEHVTGAHGVTFRPHGTLTCPDALIVPGGGWNERSGKGAWHEAQSDTLPRRLVQLHDQGILLASVCTGGMLLATAGLLTGRRAVTHRGALNELRELGARVVEARVVDDGDIVTSGGVTSGIDLALHLIDRLFGADIRCAVEVELEHRGVPAESS